MKIIAKREAILSPLQAVIGVVERRQTMPILANVLLSAKGGRVAITATDLEVELAKPLIQQGSRLNFHLSRNRSIAAWSPIASAASTPASRARAGLTAS